MIPDVEVFTFPDIVIVCEKPIIQKSPNGLDALLNPTIIVEVLSDSTELYDRSEKFEAYQKIESLKEYVLVSSKKKKIKIYKHNSAETWIHQMAKEGEIRIGEFEIDLAAVYDRVEFGWFIYLVFVFPLLLHQLLSPSPRLAECREIHLQTLQYS
jgi:Uma2 family endonuclease